MNIRLFSALLATTLMIPSLWAEPESETNIPPTNEAARETTDEDVDNSAPLPKSAKAPRELEGGWVLAWSEEFNGTRLDTKNWNYELGVIRNEGSSQAYTKDCVKVKDGVLQLISKAEKTRNENFGKRGVGHWPSSVKTQPYASGSVTTRGTRTFSPPSRLEFRARIPKAKGVWPAIWTMHQNQYQWPANGEIDILEHISQEPNTVYSIFRWGKNGTRQEYKVTRTTHIPKYSKEFHTYVLEWDFDMMRILIDGNEVGHIDINAAKYSNGDNPLLTPCYIIMNTAIGGKGTWPEKADKPEEYPVTFEIDYVRHYTKKGAKPSSNSKKPGKKPRSKAER